MEGFAQKKPPGVEVEINTGRFSVHCPVLSTNRFALAALGVTCQ
jgi:hypothetical protein